MSESDSYCDKCNTVYPYIGILGGGPCECGGYCIPSSQNLRIIKGLRTRIEELTKENNNLIVKVQFAESVIRDEKHIERTATEAALRWAYDDFAVFPHEKSRLHFIKRGLKALLGNNETNTNNQGEINA